MAKRFFTIGRVRTPSAGARSRRSFGVPQDVAHNTHLQFLEQLTQSIGVVPRSI
jgi:hypothetical protein